MYTSGTESRPKGALLTSRALMWQYVGGDDADPRWIAAVTAVVVPKPGVELTPEQVVEHCRATS